MINKWFGRNVFLAGIIFLAAFLRFFQLGINPPSLTWDEVAWGYNAYTLGTDLRDEFGRFLPLDYLESFGDFKPPMYAYLDVLPVKLFGLNEFAVRFPSAFFGVMTVLVTYFLTKRIFPNEKLVPFLATAVLAISPWHINLSRAAFEANVATFFLVSGVWLWLKAMREKKWYLLLSVISFVASTYTFNTARIVAPILVFVLMIGFRKQLKMRKKHVFTTVLVGIVLLIPLASFMLTPQARLRFQEVNIFSDITIINKSNQEVTNDNNAWWSKIIHNRRYLYTIAYIQHYFDNINPSFLFINGDGNPKFSTRDVGQLYLWELPFVIAGAFFIFRKKEGNWWIVPLWLIIGIIPAATARETPHALRIETTLPTFQILVAYGIVNIILNSRIKKIIVYGISFFALFNFLYYFHGYYAHYPREFSGEWQYGYKESIAYVQKVSKEYDEIRITTHLGRPYIYYLFYMKTDPAVFRKNAIIKRDHFGFVTVEGFNNYRFSDNLHSVDNGSKKILFINSLNQTPKDAKVLQTFFLLNGDPALVAYE